LPQNSCASPNAKTSANIDRFAFYEATKTLTAAPPDPLRVNPKYVSPYYVLNVTGVIIATNHKVGGLFLPPHDRRHYVAWSPVEPSDFSPDDWVKYWTRLNAGGAEAVADHLRALDLARFKPKAPPPHTQAFWEMANAMRSEEESEMDDVIENLGTPKALVIGDLIASADLLGEQCGYRRLANRWVIGGQRIGCPDGLTGLIFLLAHTRLERRSHWRGSIAKGLRVTSKGIRPIRPSGPPPDPAENGLARVELASLWRASASSARGYFSSRHLAWVAQNARSLTFPILLMRKWVDLRPSAVKAMARRYGHDRNRRDAGRAHRGQLRGCVLAARSYARLPTGAGGRTRAQLTNLVRCLAQAPSGALWSVYRQMRRLVRDSFCWIRAFHSRMLCAHPAPRRLDAESLPYAALPVAWLIRLRKCCC
jgi:hypothetical protein